MHRSLDKRLADLERAHWARLTPLERAHELVARGVSPGQWADAELRAFCDERPSMATLSDAELDVLASDPWTPEAHAIMARLEEMERYAQQSR